MKTFLMILLAVASIILIASVLLQSGSSAGLSGSIAGGAEQLFGKKTQESPPCGLFKFPRLPSSRWWLSI